MKRILIIGVLGVAMLSMLLVGLALGLLVTPVRAQIGNTIERVLDSSGIQERIEPKITVLSQAAQSEEKGILIAGVVEGSPAEKAGLRRGDILLEVDGQEVNDLPALQSLLQTHQSGDALELLVQRGDEQVTLNAALADTPAENGEAKVTMPFLGILPCGGDVIMHGVRPFSEEDLRPGARILEVVEGSPAEQAGLQAGDLITSVDGQPVDMENDLAEAVAAHNPGDSVKLEVLSEDNEQRDVTVTLGENPEKQGAAWLGVRYGPSVRIFKAPHPNLLPEGSGGEDQLMPRYGGIPFPPGVFHQGGMIQEVTADSPADKAGLKAGQVILSIDGETLENPSSLSEILSQHKPGDTITLRVAEPRGGDPKDVNVTLGENPEKQGTAWLGMRFVFNGIRFEFQGLPES